MSPPAPSRTTTRNTFATWLLTLATALAGALSLNAPASAAGACPVYPPPVNFHTGGQSAFNSGIFGVSARIETNQPDLCGADASSSGSSGPWAMVAARSKTYPTSDLALGYAQAGYQQTGSASGFYGMTGIYTFSQYTKKCSSTLSCGTTANFVTKFSAAPSGPTVYSAIQFSDGLVHMHAGDRHIDQTGYSPTGVWQPAWQGQFYGETTETESDQVGTASDPTTFDQIKKYSSSGSGSNFVSIPADTDYPSNYHSQSSATVAAGVVLNIWTAPTTR